MGHGGVAPYSALLDPWRSVLGAAAWGSRCIMVCRKVFIAEEWGQYSPLFPPWNQQLLPSFVLTPYFLIYCFFNCLRLLPLPYPPWVSSLLFAWGGPSWILGQQGSVLPFLPPLSLCNHYIYFLLEPEWVTLRYNDWSSGGLVNMSKRTGHNEVIEASISKCRWLINYS